MTFLSLAELELQSQLEKLEVEKTNLQRTIRTLSRSGQRRPGRLYELVSQGQTCGSFQLVSTLLHQHSLNQLKTRSAHCPLPQIYPVFFPCMEVTYLYAIKNLEKDKKCS